MPAKSVTYNSQNYAGTLGSGLVTLDLFYFFGPVNGYTHTLHIHTAIVRLG